MKLLFVSQYFWPEEFRSNDIVRGLCDRGYNITVLTGLPNYPAGRFYRGYSFFKGPFREKWEGVTIVRMPLFPRGRSSRTMIALNYISFALFSSVLSPFRIRGKYDLILCWMASPVTQVIPAIFAKRLVSAPLVLWVMDLWPDSLAASGRVGNGALIHAAGFLTRWIYRRCDRILGQSRRFATHIAGVAGISASDVEYLPQWEPHLPESSNPPPAIPTLNKGFRVVFTGNVGFSQDFDTIVAAAEILKDREDVTWIVVGDGQALENVRRQMHARSLEGRIQLLGRYPIEAMPLFYKQAGALLATLRPADIFARTIPTKIQSYLGAGVPLITAIDGEVADLMAESGAGISVPAGDPVRLAEAVQEMADMPPAARNEMGVRGRKYFLEHFDRDRLLDKLESLLREEAEKHAGR